MKLVGIFILCILALLALVVLGEVLGDVVLFIVGEA